MALLDEPYMYIVHNYLTFTYITSPLHVKYFSIMKRCACIVFIILIMRLLP